MNNLKSRRAFIVGLSSTKITNKERLFLRKYKPWGVILFARNIKSVDQTKKLTNDIKKIFKDPKYPILIDEEGGMPPSSSIKIGYFGSLKIFFISLVSFLV